MKTPEGRYVAAQLAREKWTDKLIRAAKQLEKIRKTLRYYEKQPIPRVEKIHPNHVKSPRRHLWKASE